MKITLPVVLILLALFPHFLFGQQRLKGTVKDFNGHLLDGATITLSRQGKVFSSALAEKGSFVLTAGPDGSYTLSASLIGYKAVSITLNLPKDSVVIIMDPLQKQLKEVTVAASKPLIERKIDRVIFNVENSIIASGGTVWEALGKV
ncbi:MAG: carboxypeptidase-like regulatory domain-containing protein [Hymenobacter sp.]|nr:MAG: carboxypeptidase-like regulatory domain-containing protein [Hymenobacter sp.]